MTSACWIIDAPLPGLSWPPSLNRGPLPPVFFRNGLFSAHDTENLINKDSYMHNHAHKLFIQYANVKFA